MTTSSGAREHVADAPSSLAGRSRVASRLREAGAAVALVMAAPWLAGGRWSSLAVAGGIAAALARGLSAARAPGRWSAWPGLVGYISFAGVFLTQFFTLGETTRALAMCVAAVLLHGLASTLSPSRRAAVLVLAGASTSLGVLLAGLALIPASADERLICDAARALAQTNPREAFDYLLFHGRWNPAAMVRPVAWVLALNLAFGPALDAGRELAGRIVSSPRARLGLLAATTVAAAALFSAGAWVSRPGRFVKLAVHTLQDYQAGIALVRESAAHRGTAPVPHHAVSAMLEGPRSVVVVIGESTARSHWRMYGYSRPTTGALEDLAPSLITYQDVVSPYSHTNRVLERVLAPEIAQGRRSDIVSVARSAGYDVAWISAQVEYGLWDSLPRLLAQGASQRVFLDSERRRSTRYTRDEELLPELEEALSAGSAKRLVFLHMMGADRPYCDMYAPEHVPASFSADPPSSAVFGLAHQRVEVDCYDRAVAYNAWVLSRILEISKSRGVDTVLYFSDHGESPASGTGHESSMHVAEHVEIPMLWWLNPSYWEKHPEAASAIRANRERPVLSSDLYWTLQDLLGVGVEGFLPERSLLRAEYRPRKRLLFDGAYDYDVWSSKSDDVERTRATMRSLAEHQPDVYRRVWAHRVDTLRMLQEALRAFAGVELDVVVQGRNLAVYHPPAPDIGLKLEDYLEAASIQPRTRFWFDMKLGTSPEEAETALRALERLAERYQLKARTIVELPPDYEHAGLSRNLAERGWMTSRYVPVALAHVVNANETERARADLERERQYISEGSFSFVSYDVELRGLAGEILRDPRLSSVRRLTWDTSRDASSRDLERAIGRFDEDVLLVTMPSRYEN